MNQDYIVSILPILQGVAVNSFEGSHKNARNVWIWVTQKRTAKGGTYSIKDNGTSLDYGHAFKLYVQVEKPGLIDAHY